MASSSSSSSINPSTPNINVPIRIEPTDEYKIQEISYDGVEKSIPPPSMSEHLSQLIQRIDFYQPIDELREELERAKTTSDDDDEEDASAQASNQLVPGSLWPFDVMRTKLRVALTEISALYDVLAIAKEKKYMVFDAVNPKQTDQRPIVALMAKKRALAAAGQILMDGSATLRATTSGRPSPKAGGASDTSWLTNDQSSSSFQGNSLGSQSEPNFYNELREMRQSWRLRRLGNEIYGDLSDFRPVGVRLMPNNRFEVIRTTPATRGPSNQALAVKIPFELEGSAYIQVSIVKSDEISLVDLSTSANGRLYEPAKDCTWQEKLESAQNVLFCKELFCHLANQAVQYQFVIPTTVTGNQIILALFPDIKLYITLIHKTPNAKASRVPTEGMEKLRKSHKQVFEHSLHQMFRDFYAGMLRKMQGRDVPRESGPYAMDKQTLYEMARQESSLDKIVQQAQHLIMRHQTIEVIDSFAAKIKDPLIISHWFCLNTPTTSIARVDIVSHNNEILGRSHMLIYVGTRQLRVNTRDCKNLVLGYEPDELRHLLVWQSCLHQFIASDKLSKLLGWYTLILNYNVNVTRQDISSTAFSLVICSSNCSHMISMKSGPQYGLSVEVAQFKESPGVTGSAITNGLTNGNSAQSTRSPMVFDEFPGDNGLKSILSSMLSQGDHSEKQLSRFQDLVENFREVDWNMMQGRDFLTKLELLMAALTDLN
uniref:Mediator of RNA polymerase II transcription subunit 17 n=1 Tax=Aceria tosichella TaxID=561515 RepID=A0A6G1SGX6_9ACAR